MSKVLENNSIVKIKDRTLHAIERKKEKSKKEIQTEVHDKEIENKEQIKTLRKRLFWILIAITILHLGLLYWFLNQSGNANLKFHGYFLSDKVLMTFLVTTTGDIAGLLVLLTKFLFNAKGKRKSWQ